jgi:hypothetical protein
VSGEWPVYIDGKQIDGQFVYMIDEGKTKQWPLSPGTHTLRCGGGWLSSPEVSFTLAEGQVAAFQCRLREGNSGDGGLIAIASLFKHDLWIILEPYEPSLPKLI